MVHQTSPERRNAYRVELTHTMAEGTTANSAGRYAVRDLSIRGALLRGCPSVALGTHIDLVVHLLGHHKMTAGGTVRRVDPLEGPMVSFAVAFDSLGADAEDMVEDTVLRQLAPKRRKVAHRHFRGREVRGIAGRKAPGDRLVYHSRIHAT